MQTSDDVLAEQLARSAGELLLEVVREARPEDLGTAELKNLGDRISQAHLAAELARWRPADAVLSEEATDDARRLDAERVWIIDPLDGTREFSEGRHDWAVHVALWQRDALAAGAVALPALGEVLSTRLERRRWERPTKVRLAVSRSRPSALVLALAEELDAELVAMGSAGYKACAVVRGDADAYVHSGGQYEWDSAAPVAVADAAGLFTSRIDGSALRYNRADPSLPDLIVCNPLLSEDLLSRLSHLLKAETR